MSKKARLQLDELKVQSFITNVEQEEAKGGLTGNCLSFINVTCPEPCDFQSIPVEECTGFLCEPIPNPPPQSFTCWG